jgi:hypothetical protein
MRAKEFLAEGGWETTVTQGTVVKPAAVRVALSQIQNLFTGFNQYLAQQGLGPVEVGAPTGSSAYYLVDPEDKVYGDIDLQVIAPATQHQTHSQFQSHWNRLVDDYIKQARPKFVHPESTVGHPIVEVGRDQYVQVDFMWHEPKTREWGRFRVTPERGVKGLLYGNIYSVLGQLLDMSIQHAGVQLKMQDGQQVPFSKQKNTTVVTVSLDPRKFVYDILVYLFSSIHGNENIKKMLVDDLLRENPGLDVNNIKIEKLVRAVQGLARSFELNNMYGQGPLKGYQDSADFLDKFWKVYQSKAMTEISSPKRDKAATPEAQARALSDQQRILQGLDIVERLFRT